MIVMLCIKNQLRSLTMLKINQGGNFISIINFICVDKHKIVKIRTQTTQTNCAPISECGSWNRYCHEPFSVFHTYSKRIFFSQGTIIYFDIEMIKKNISIYQILRLWWLQLTWFDWWESHWFFLLVSVWCWMRTLM